LYIHKKAGKKCKIQKYHPVLCGIPQMYSIFVPQENCKIVYGQW